MTDQTRQTNKWIIAFVVMLPTVIEIIDTSIVNVSLNHIRGSLSAGIDEATWAISAYLVSNAIVIPMSGWLSRLFGRKKYQIWSILLFTASSFMCGAAWSLQSLIAFRILQGFGGGGLVPVSQAILLEAFPKKEHGMAMALFGMGILVGPIAGPLLGGYITFNFSWRWIFYINVPIGLLAILLSVLFIHDPPYMKRQRMKIDYMGFFFLAVGLGALQYVLDTGQRKDWFASPYVSGIAVISAVCLIFLVLNEMFTDDPIINLGLFKNRSFASGSVVMFFVMFNLFASLILLPIFLQTLMGYSSLQAGLVLGPGGFAAILVMPISGMLVTRVSPKKVLTAGILICAGTTYAMSLFNLSTDFWSFVWPRITLGIGMPLIFIPLTVLTLSPVQKENMGEATSMYNMLRNLGGSVGIAFAGTMSARRGQFHQARLAEHLSVLDPSYAMAKAKAAAVLSWKGIHYLPPDAGIYRQLVFQARMLGFNDAFFLTALLLLSSMVLVLLIKEPTPDAEGG